MGNHTVWCKSPSAFLFRRENLAGFSWFDEGKTIILRVFFLGKACYLVLLPFLPSTLGSLGLGILIQNQVVPNSQLNEGGFDCSDCEVFSLFSRSPTLPSLPHFPGRSRDAPTRPFLRGSGRGWSHLPPSSGQAGPQDFFVQLLKTENPPQKRGVSSWIAKFFGVPSAGGFIPVPCIDDQRVPPAGESVGWVPTGSHPTTSEILNVSPAAAERVLHLSLQNLVGFFGFVFCESATFQFSRGFTSLGAFFEEFCQR